MQRKGLLFAAGLLGIFLASQTWALSWKGYVNPRFGYHVDVPASFVPQPPPENDDGRVFDDPEGGSFTVYGGYNVFDATPEGLQRERRATLESEGASVTYASKGKRWFVLSGTQEETIFYEKSLFSTDGGTIATVILRYPLSRKRAWDPVVARAAKSLAFSEE